MCHVMSIIEKVTCMGGFNVLVSEFLVFSGRKDGVDLILKDFLLVKYKHSRVDYQKGT